MTLWAPTEWQQPPTSKIYQWLLHVSCIFLGAALEFLAKEKKVLPDLGDSTSFCNPNSATQLSHQSVKIGDVKIY